MTTKNNENAGRCSARNRVECKGDREWVAAVVVFIHGISNKKRTTMEAENSKDRGDGALLFGREAVLLCNPLRVT